MFETAGHAEISILSAFRARGERTWSYVEFPLHVPWFHWVYRVPLEEGGHLRRTIFLSDVPQLLQFHAEGPKVYEVQIVLPDHMMGAGRWTMEPLTEIWIGTEPKTEGQRAYVYVLANGKRHLDSGLTDNEADLCDRKRIYSRASQSCRKSDCIPTGRFKCVKQCGGQLFGEPCG